MPHFLTRLVPIIVMIFVTIPHGSLFSQNIKDVSRNDTAYPAVKNSIKKGYLSLFQDGSFKGDRPLSRKEAALILDKLLRDVKSHQLDLSASDIKELSHLANSFKSYLEEFEVTKTDQGQVKALLTAEQKTLHHDLTQLNEELKDEVQRLKKERDEHNLLVWIGIGLAAALGILL